MVKAIWTDLAIGDLKSIHKHIARDSKFYSDRFINKIITQVNQLETLPNFGRIIPEFASDKIRELIEGDYRIVYRVHTDHVGMVPVHNSAEPLRGV